jgi:hypothetical protein
MKVLGRYDRVDLPDLKLRNIYAKVDTGAYRCSMHCHEVEVINGQLHFILLDHEHSEFTGIRFVFDDYFERDIRNSFGETERRFVIVTTVRIFNEDITAEFSLCNRGSLKFPILIGRKILRNRFLIDVKKKNLSFKEKRKEKRARRLVVRQAKSN